MAFFSTLKFPLWLLVFVSFAAAAQKKKDQFTRSDTLLGSLRAERTCFDVQRYDLQLLVQPHTNILEGTAQVTLLWRGGANTLQLDLDPRLSITDLRETGGKMPLNYTRQFRAVWVSVPPQWKAGQRYSLNVTYSGKPRLAGNPPWDGGLVRREDNRGRPFVGMACQGDGASLWYPCKDHPSDRADQGMTLALTVPDSLAAIANGRLLDSAVTGQRPNYRTWRWGVRNPIATYNISFYIGKLVPVYDTVQLVPGQVDTLKHWVLDYNRNWARTHFKQAKTVLRGLGELLAPYPFRSDGYKLVEAPYWGMEHQSAVAYGNHYQNNAVGFDFIILHESAHEWWGNSVAAADQAELWIQESLTTYMEALFIEKMRGADSAQKWLDGQRQNIVNKRPVVGPLGVAYQSLHDADMYYKGTWMFHTLRQQVGDDAAWLGHIQACYRHFAGQTITTNQMVDWWSQRLGRPMQPFFYTYLHQAALPVFQYYFQGGKLHYRVTECNGNFNIQVPVVGAKPGQQQVLTATTSWQQAPLSPEWLPDVRRLLLVAQPTKPSR